MRNTLSIYALLVAGVLTAADGPRAAQAPRGPGVRGTVLDTRDAPLAGAAVELLPVPDPHAEALALRRGTFRPEPVAEAVAAADGSFRLSAPTPGVWRLRASADGRLPMVTQPLALVADHTLDAVRLPQAVEVELRVRDPAARPAAGAFVRTLSHEDLAALRSGATWQPERRQGRTGDDGRLRLVRMPDERLRAWAITPGFWQGEGDLGERSGALELRAARRRELRLVRHDGGPAEGVVVGAGEVAWPVAVSDRTGTVSFAAPHDEEVRLRLVLPGGWIVPASLPPAGDDDRPAVVELPPVGGLSGQVVDAGTRSPLAGAVVWPAAVPGRAAITDARGRFAWSGLPPGEPFLRAAAPRHLEAEVRVGVQPARTARAVVALRPAAAAAGRVVDVRGRPVNGATVTIAAAGDEDPRVDAGEPRSIDTADGGRFRVAGLDPDRGYRLEVERRGYAPAGETLSPGGSKEWTGLEIVLVPGGSAVGRVVDREKRPVPGAEVRLLGDGGAADATGAGADRTDVEGRFRILDLHAGRFTLSVRAAGFAPRVAPGVELPEGNAAVDLGVVVLEPEAAVTGRVEEPEGAPVAGAAVRTVERSLTTVPPATAATGTDGSFRLTGLAPGERVTLVAELDGFAPALSGEVQAPTRGPVVLVLRRAASLSGTVITSGGEPVNGAQVWAGLERSAEAPPGRDPSWRRVGPVVTDAEGRFELVDVPPGTVRLGAVARGWPRREIAALEVPAGGRLTGLELVLEPGGTVEGRVFSADGEPVAGAEVFVVRAPDRIRGASKGVRSDGEGGYELIGVPPGAVRIAARHPRHGTALRGLEVDAGNHRLDLTFEAGAAVVGRVVDESGAGIAGAEVALDGADPAAPGIEGRTDPSGSYRLAPVAEGRYRLSAAKRGYVRAELPRPLEVSGTDPITAPEIELPAGGTVEGRLLGLDESEIAAVEVVARGPATGPGREGQILAGEQYRIYHLLPGEYLVSAHVPRTGRQAQGRVELEEGTASAHLDLDFEDGLRLSGRVLYQGGGLAGAETTLTGVDRPARASALTDAGGAFEITGIVPGVYDVGIVHPLNGLRTHRTVVMDRDQRIEVELAAGSVSGRVVEADSGEGLSEVVLRFHSLGAASTAAAGESFEVSTDTAGEFHAEGLVEGRYRVEALRFGYRSVAIDVAVEPRQEVSGLLLELPRAATADAPAP